MKILQTETTKGNIEYSLVGKGKMILIVHGGHINCREAIFQKGLDPEKFCFITPSRPGYGKTPLTASNKSPKGTADLFMALLDKLEIPKVSVIGVSGGGLTALELVANYPARIEKFVLMSALTKKWFAETDKFYTGGKILFAPQIEWFTWFVYRLFFGVLPKMMAKTMFKELSKFRPVAILEDELYELKQMTLGMRSGYGFVNDLDQSIDQEILGRIASPTLILHSNLDNQVDMSHPLNAQTKIKNAKLLTFNNHWGHLLWLGHEYQEISGKLTEFLMDN